jgi:hypothetical protein
MTTPSTLLACPQNHPPYCAFSGLGDCPNNLILTFLSPEKVPTRIYGNRGSFIHSSAWKVNSANFAKVDSSH